MKEDLDNFNALIKESIGPNFSHDYLSIDAWSSMQCLIIVSAIDEHYDVLISHEELKSSKKTDDLFEVIKQKKA